MWALLALLAVCSTTLALPVSQDNTCQSLANCNGHGACGVNDGDLYCFCYDGWVGVRCQIRQDRWLNGADGEPCYDTIDCNDNGRCSGSGDTVKCNCYPGWYGVRCQIPLTEPITTERPTTTTTVPTTTTTKPTTTTKTTTTTTKKPTTTTRKHTTTKPSERECDPNIECYGHGTCYGTNYEWECYCYAGYYGQFCQYKM